MQLGVAVLAVRERGARPDDPAPRGRSAVGRQFLIVSLRAPAALEVGTGACSCHWRSALPHEPPRIAYSIVGDPTS